MFKNLINKNNVKEVIYINSNKVDLALYVINLKIADVIKNNEEKDYQKFKKILLKLTEEKEEIYKDNEEIINKVLNVYLEEVKKRG